MPRRRKETFIWIPPSRKTKYSCTINEIDVTDFILSGSFPHGLITEELICEIELDNSGEDFTKVFSHGNEIEFKMDFSDGTTTQFKGNIEEIRDKLRGGFGIGIKGAHFTARLLDVMVTAEFDNASISDIRKSLIDDHLTGYTTNNIEDNLNTITIKFANKLLLDCIIQLDLIGDEDTYIDFDKDFHTFKKNSKNNDNEAFVWNDSLIELRGLGSDSAEVRNKVKVYGEAGGLPVIWTTEDVNSQTTYGIKEKVITGTSILDEDEAKEEGDASIVQEKTPTTQGSAVALLMPRLVPGSLTYIIFPPNKVHARYRVVKYVYRVPAERTEAFFNQERSIPKLFKDRILKDQSQETILNPFKMLYSYNFTFDNYNKIDEAASNNIEVEDGKLKLITGVIGTMISQVKEVDDNITKISLQLVGEALSGTKYFIDVDGTNTFTQQISPNVEETVDNPGKELKLKIELNSISTAIDAAVLLFK